ncbi:MAG TPA: SPOR domain-containing protein [Gemmatimonadales bacterium]|nr:SPOR domain-containing protein [Gemmatimonadales bacterium]
MGRATLLAALLTCAAPAALAAQGAVVDPRLASALRDAVDGRLDSARVTLAALAKDVPPGSPTYPDLLFGQALVAPTVADERQVLQRLVVEYPLSPWADDAALRLTQLEYAAGDRAAAARQAERFRTEHAQSPLFPQAALWAGRAAFASRDTVTACGWATDGVARAGEDVATRDALRALAGRCGAKLVVAKAEPPASAPAATPSRDTAVPAAPPKTSPPPVAAPADGTWRVQIVAAKTPADAERELARARKAGFDGAVVQEGGYHKVRLGGFATRADASAAAQRVKGKLGGQPFVVQAP